MVLVGKEQAMSQAAYEQVVGKLMLDVEFRNQVSSDIRKALAGYDLSDDEFQGIKDIDLGDFAQRVSGLDERVSKRRRGTR
jgi:hypothetical protein